MSYIYKAKEYNMPYYLSISFPWYLRESKTQTVLSRFWNRVTDSISYDYYYNTNVSFNANYIWIRNKMERFYQYTHVKLLSFSSLKSNYYWPERKNQLSKHLIS